MTLFFLLKIGSKTREYKILRGRGHFVLIHFVIHNLIMWINNNYYFIITMWKIMKIFHDLNVVNSINYFLVHLNDDVFQIYSA